MSVAAVQYTMAPVDADRELIDRCTRGERAAWDDFVGRYYEVARAAARTALIRARRRAPVDDVENVAQSVFTALYEDSFRRLRQYQGRCSVRSWIWSVTVNHALNYVRTEALRRGRSLDADPLLVPEAAREERPEEAIVELTRRLEAYMAKLNAKERLALKLHYTDGLPQKNIAKILGVAENTIGALISRARTKLQELAKSTDSGSRVSEE